MSNCPCINCITFPICKAQATEYMKDCLRIDKTDLHNNAGVANKTDRIYGFNVYISVLRHKCSSIREWGKN